MMGIWNLLCLLYMLFLKIAKCQKTFSMQLIEEVKVVSASSDATCFNMTASVGNNTEGELIEFKFARGVLINIGYDLLSLQENGETSLSIQAEFKCCSAFCQKFSRLISEGEWVYGNILMDIEEESSVGIFYNKVPVCHESYLKGIFGNLVTFSPFALEGNLPECIDSRDSRYFKKYVGVGKVIAITASSSTRSLTIKFAFAVSKWSQDFMLRFMKESEHGTLGNVVAEAIIRKGKKNTSFIPEYGIYCMALAGFCYAVVFFAIFFLICTRTKRSFLKQTWVTYDLYLERKTQKTAKRSNVDVGLDNIALQEV